LKYTSIPVLVLADAGIPMIVVTLPGMLALLLPIILIEAWLCRKWLGLPPWVALKSNAAANLASTLLGVPAAWCLAFLFEFFIFGTISDLPSIQRWNSPIAHIVETVLAPAWLGPAEKNLPWMIPLATIVLLLPTFFVSVVIETFVIGRMLGTAEEDPSNLSSDRIGIAVRNANIATYGLLIVGSAVWLLVSLVRHPR